MSRIKNILILLYLNYISPGAKYFISGFEKIKQPYSKESYNNFIKLTLLKSINSNCQNHSNQPFFYQYLDYLKNDREVNFADVAPFKHLCQSNKTSPEHINRLRHMATSGT